MNNSAAEILSGSQIVASGLQGEIPYLEVAKGPDRFRAYIYRDGEGNGPGFIFGLAIPDSPEVKELQRQVRAGGDPELRATLQRRWEEEYYQSAEDLDIVTALTADAPEGFPVLQVVFADQPQEQPFALEVSADQEGNYGGCLVVERQG
jgi:hypothetical protein